MKPAFARQQGYFIIIAIVLILVIGLLGVIVAQLFATRAQLSAAQFRGLQAFYIADSGLEIGTRYLTRPSLATSPIRIACSAVTGHAELTNATVGAGAFTLTTINSSPIFATDTLSGAVTSSASSITLASSSGFAPSGRIILDREAMDYAAISGNTLVGVTRGAGGTTASSHPNGAAVGQYQCNLNSLGAVPTVAASTYARDLQSNVELEYGWAVANLSSSNFVMTRWNHPTEVSWNATTLAGGSSVANLRAISMLSQADGWAVGERANNSFIFLRWNGSNWALTSISGSCSNQHLNGVSMVSSQLGFAVGERYRAACAGSGPFRYTIMRWNGTAWSLLTPTTSPSIPADNSNNQNLNAVHVIDTNGDAVANIGFAVGDNGVILQFNGTNWVSVTSPTTRNLNGVYTVSASEAWAVGASGTILRWSGGTWSTVSSPTSGTLNAIVMGDSTGNGTADYGWAVGGSGVIATYNGSSWSVVDVGGDNLFAVDSLNSKDAWAVGANGAVFHWDGSSWNEGNSGTTRPLNGISLVGARSNPSTGWKQTFG